MTTEEQNLNTEPNEVAGNRPDGPVGNTATQHTAPGTGVGMPGGAPNPAAATTPVSSEALAAAETSPGQGGVDAAGATRENQPASPAAVDPGTGMSPTPRDAHHDQAQRDNDNSTADRGAFGLQDDQGTTHGGSGNQNRPADYEPRNSAEDRYYGGAGAPGVQTNSYRAYDGHDARPDTHAADGPGPGSNAAPAPAAPAAQAGATQNDNGSRPGPGSGYAADYGHTSLPGSTGAAAPSARPVAGQRNQTEDYLPTPGDGDSPAPAAAADPDHQAPAPAPDYQTGGDRTGYTAAGARNGDAAQGVGSRGGSYNDAYDDSRPGSSTGSPAAGDQRREDLAGNYGSEARAENRASADENDVDHGAPRRNAGRE